MMEMIDMIRGVSFHIPQMRGTVLWQMLSCINIEQYCWYNIESQNEVWTDTPGNVFFEAGYYDGKRFLQQIQLDSYIVFLKLQAYFEDSKFFDIHTYNDFQESDCQLLLLIYDCEFVDIYAKDQDIIKSIYENALINNYTEVEYITKNNHVRTKLDVL